MPVPPVAESAPVPEEKKGNGMLIGGGLALLAAAGIAFAVMSGGGGGDEAGAGAGGDDKPPPTARVDTAALTKVLDEVDGKIAAGEFAVAKRSLDAIQGQLEGAPELAVRGAELATKIEVGQLYAQAKQLEDQGKTNEALDAYHDVLEKDANHADSKAAVDRLASEMAKAGEEGVTGELVIQSVPSGDVFIDGVNKGKTPFKGQLAAGSHTVRVQRDGWYSKESTVGIKPNGSSNLQWTLTKRKRRGGGRPSSAPTPPPTEPTPTPEPAAKKKKPDSGEGGDVFMPTKKKKGSGVFLPVGE